LGSLANSVEPIDDHSIAVVAILRQWMAIVLVNAESVHLAFFL
jgi:hypothetical protein